MMTTSTHARASGLRPIVAVLVALAAGPGCGAGTADLSPSPPTFNTQFEMRNPRVCAKVTHVPSAAEATVMVQCEWESASRTSGSSPNFQLVTDVSLEIGSSKPYNPRMDSALDDIDPSSNVYPLRGSSTSYWCTPANPYNRGKNCGKSSGGQDGHGACWHTQFGEWRCYMTMGGRNQELQVKGPVTY